MPRLVRLRPALKHLVHPLRTPDPPNPISIQQTPHEFLQSSSRPLPPNLRFEDISKGVIQVLPDTNRRSSRDREGNALREVIRREMTGDRRLTGQQKIIKSEKEHWAKQDLKQLRRAGGLTWALREK